MPLLGFALAVAFVPGWYGAATTPRWALIAVAVPLILLFTRPQRHITAAHAFGLAVIGWAAVSLTWTANVYDGFDQLLQYLFLAGVFVLGARTADLKPVMTGFTWGIAVSSAIALVQWLGHWGWIVWPHGYAPSGLFINENYLAEPAALCLVAVVAYRQWYLIPLLLPVFRIHQFTFRGCRYSGSGCGMGLALAAILDVPACGVPACNPGAQQPQAARHHL